MAILMEQGLESAFIFIFFRGYVTAVDQEQIIGGLGTYLVRSSGLQLPELGANPKDAVYMLKFPKHCFHKAPALFFQRCLFLSYSI